VVDIMDISYNMSVLIAIIPKLDFSLEYYTEVMDLSYLLDSLNADAFGKKYQSLNKALCELIEDFSLVGFYTLCVEVSLPLLGEGERYYVRLLTLTRC
jgi:hypothetical protein